MPNNQNTTQKINQLCQTQASLALLLVLKLSLTNFNKAELVGMSAVVKVLKIYKNKSKTLKLQWKTKQPLLFAPRPSSYYDNFPMQKESLHLEAKVFFGCALNLKSQRRYSCSNTASNSMVNSSRTCSLPYNTTSSP